MPGDRRSPRTRRLWTCPKCGKRFVGVNMWHSCGPHTVKDFLEGKGSRARALFDTLVETIGSCGEFDYGTAKTRIAFMVRVRFAGVSALSERGMTLAFALPYSIDSPRIRKIEHIAKGWVGHHMRITDPSQLDDEVREWLCESRRLMGEQEQLKIWRASLPDPEG